MAPSTYAQLERIEQPMRRGAWEEAWAENYIYRQPTAQRIREASAFAAAAGPVKFRKAIENEWQDELGDRIPVFTTEVALLDCTREPRAA